MEPWTDRKDFQAIVEPEPELQRMPISVEGTSKRLAYLDGEKTKLTWGLGFVKREQEGTGSGTGS